MARTPKRPPQNSRRKATRASRKPGTERRTQPSGRASPARRSKSPPAGRRPLHRESEDGFWRPALGIRAVAIWLLGLEEYAVVIPLPAPRLLGLGKNMVQLDLLYLCSWIEGDDEAQARKRLQQMQSSGRADPLGFTFLNVELKAEQQPGRDGDQLLEHRVAMWREHGRMCPLRSAQFVSGEREPSQWWLGGMGANEWAECVAEVIFRGNLDADQAPAAVREDPMGAIVMLRLRNGCQPHHVRRVVTGPWGDRWTTYHTEKLRMAVHMDPKLFKMVIEESNKFMEDKIMANGTVAQEANLAAFYRNMEELVSVLDTTQFPTYRKLKQKSEREKQQLKQKLEQKLQASEVAGLLGILAGRGLQLTPAQEKRLNAKPLAKLPPLQLALEAQDASDFARRAGLTNGRR